MITASVIFGLAYLAIASGRIPNAVIAITGATAMVFLGVIGDAEALTHVDLNVILLLGSMMTLAGIIGRTGAFDWAALRGAQLVKGNGFLLICFLSLITGVTSAFLDNVTVVVLAVPITLSLCGALKLNPMPFLLAQVFASNIGGTATIVGDPPNIIVASAADITFGTFLVNIAPVTVFSMAALLALLYVWFRKDVRTTPEARAEIMGRNASEAIEDVPLLVKSAAVFALTVAGFLAHGLLGVSPAFVAMAGAALLLLVSRLHPREALRHVEWNTLAFFTGLFILVGGLVETGVTAKLQEWIVDLSGGSEEVLTYTLVWFGGVASAIVDNVPFAATMTEVVKNMAGTDPTGRVSPLWWGLILGADLGGNATMVGASANVIVVSLARAHGYPISFVGFLKYGVVISLVTLVISTAYLRLVYH